MFLTVGMLARNCAYELGMTARAALLWADHIVLLNHCSTDATEAVIQTIAREYPGRVTALREHDSTWEEMRHRQRLLDSSRRLHSTHFATVDSDEILTHNLVPVIRALILQTPERQCFELPWVCLKGGRDRYYSSGRWMHNRVSMAFSDHPALYWDSDKRGGFDHHHRPPMGQLYVGYCPVHQDINPLLHSGGLMHLQFVNERRLKYKQYWYCLTERKRWGHVRSDYVGTVHDAMIGESQPCPAEWWAGYEHLLPYFNTEGEIWQEQACRDMLRENPGLGEGLNDFGLGVRLD